MKYLVLLLLLCSCSKKEQGTVWKVAFIDTYIKSQDYVYNFEGKGCRCSHSPYLFGSTFYKEPLGIDSLSLVNKFRETYDEGYIPYAVYAYCSVEDWNDNPRDIEYYDKRSTIIDAVELCYKYGLVDSIGHYK